MVDGLFFCANSQAAEQAIPHLYKQELKRPTPVRRRLSRTHAVLGRAIPGGWCRCQGWKYQPLRIPLLIRPVRRTSVIVVRRTDELLCSGYKWAMIALLESMTRLESRFLVTLTRSSRVEKDGYSSHVFHRMTRDSSQSHFCKISEPLIDKPSLFACKEMIMFWSSNDQNWSKFSALTFKWCYTIS